MSSLCDVTEPGRSVYCWQDGGREGHRTGEVLRLWVKEEWRQADAPWDRCWDNWWKLDFDCSTGLSPSVTSGEKETAMPPPFLSLHLQSVILSGSRDLGGFAVVADAEVCSRRREWRRDEWGVNELPTNLVKRSQQNSWHQEPSRHTLICMLCWGSNQEPGTS